MNSIVWQYENLCVLCKRLQFKKLQRKTALKIMRGNFEIHCDV